MFGKRNPINIYADIIALRDSTGGNPPSSLALDRPNFSATNGLQVWLLGERQLKSLRDYLKRMGGADFLSHPRISTADGVEASIFVGESVLLNGLTNDIGIKAAFFPRVRSDSTDLFAMISVSELVTNQNGVPNGLMAASAVSIRTNLDLAARLQVPKGSGLFLLQGNSTGSDHKRFGALIEPP